MYIQKEVRIFQYQYLKHCISYRKQIERRLFYFVAFLRNLWNIKYYCLFFNLCKFITFYIQAETNYKKYNRHKFSAHAEKSSSNFKVFIKQNLK